MCISQTVKCQGMMKKGRPSPDLSAYSLGCLLNSHMFYIQYALRVHREPGPTPPRVTDSLTFTAISKVVFCYLSF